MRQGVDWTVAAPARRIETKRRRQTANPRGALRNWPVRIFPIETPCITTLLNSIRCAHTRDTVDPSFPNLAARAPPTWTVSPYPDTSQWYAPSHSGPLTCGARSTDGPWTGANTSTARRECAVCPSRRGQNGQARRYHGQAHQAGLQVAHWQRLDKYVFRKRSATPGMKPREHPNMCEKSGGEKVALGYRGDHGEDRTES
jgi:hypothetical protein